MFLWIQDENCSSISYFSASTELPAVKLDPNKYQTSILVRQRLDFLCVWIEERYFINDSRSMSEEREEPGNMDTCTRLPTSASFRSTYTETRGQY